MSAVPKNVVELRRLLVEKFPGVKMSAEPRLRIADRWGTGIAGLDQVLGGGLAKGAITEVVSSGVASGSALLIAGLLNQARKNGEWLALIDGSDSFDPEALENVALDRLLWVRCFNAREAIKVADLLLHDGTTAIAVLDLTFSPPRELRRTPSSTWFRLERFIENTPTALVVLNPDPMIATAETRLELKRCFSLDALDQTHETLLNQMSANLSLNKERGLLVSRVVPSRSA